MEVSSTRRTQTISRLLDESRSEARWTRNLTADDPAQSPLGIWLVLGVLVALLAAGCGGGNATKSIDTGSLKAGDLPGLLPDAETVGAVLGVTIDQVEERSDLSQSFEHTNVEQLKGAHVGFYRVANEPEGHIPTGSSTVQLALYETSDSADAAMEVITGELELDPDSVRSEFDVADLADAGKGVVLDADASFTWTMLRWDTLLVQIVAFHEPDTDLTEQVRGLAEDVASNLSNADR